ncbi:MAG: oligopeptide/dipeptide ABC transporter ATP-binding protein [Bacilli bacterium]
MTAVDRVDLRLERGAHLGLVGASGCGKSTVVNLLQRLIEPSGGTIHFGGVDITKMREGRLRAFRKRMQSVSQNPYASLFPNKTIGQNIVEPLLIHNTGTKQERRLRAQELMERVGVPADQFYAFPHEISGGQQQRIAIARALALEPELLILDEAVSSLDVSIQAQILHLLSELRGQFDLTYLFVSHNLAVVRLLCSQIAVMFLGRIMEIGPTERVFDRPLHPYTQALIAAVPEFDDDETSDTSAVDDGQDLTQMPSPYDIPSGCCYRAVCPMARERCRSEEPLVRSVAHGQYVACHFAEEWGV